MVPHPPLKGQRRMAPKNPKMAVLNGELPEGCACYGQAPSAMQPPWGGKQKPGLGAWRWSMGWCRVQHRPAGRRVKKMFRPQTGIMLVCVTVFCATAFFRAPGLGKKRSVSVCNRKGHTRAHCAREGRVIFLPIWCPTRQRACKQVCRWARAEW